MDLALVAEEGRKYKIDFMCLRETGIPFSAEMRHGDYIFVTSSDLAWEEELAGL